MKCSICEKEITHPIIKDYFGNNPWPIRTNEDARCCDSCNTQFVIPARITMMTDKDASLEPKIFSRILNKLSYKDLCQYFK